MQQNRKHYYFRPEVKTTEAIPLKPNTIAIHMTGWATLGLYAINPKNQSCKWLTIDENPPFDDRNPWGKQRRLQQIYARLRRDEDEHYRVKRTMPLVDSSKADVVFIDDMRKEDESTEALCDAGIALDS
jgi:hypothetical protein